MNPFGHAALVSLGATIACALWHHHDAAMWGLLVTLGFLALTIAHERRPR